MPWYHGKNIYRVIQNEPTKVNFIFNYTLTKDIWLILYSKYDEYDDPSFSSIDIRKDIRILPRAYPLHLCSGYVPMWVQWPNATEIVHHRVRSN